jgi:phage replication-related protein YjqB (UPF0714/DUF867 family)
MRFAALLAKPGVEEHSELRSSFGFMAFHGGNLERGTDEIAAEAARRAGASLYAVIQPTPMREHLPSTAVQAAESPRLAAFFAHVEVVIAVHGYGREGLWTSMLLGGSNRHLAGRLAGHLRAGLPEFTALDAIDDIPSELRGMHPDNPVNQPRYGGVQIELPPRVRGLTPHAASFDRTDGRIPWTEALIAALATTAQTWTPESGVASRPGEPTPLPVRSA